MEWRDRAACRGRDNALWFPPPNGNATGVEAREVCAACPVRAECLAWAIETHQPDGIWGGLSVSQRRSGMSFDRALELARLPGERRRKAKADRDRRKSLSPEQQAAKAEYLARWREANREKARQYRRAYYRRNRERTMQVNEAWRQANPDKVAEYRKRRTA